MSKEIDSDVSDFIRPYLNEIAERLWAERAAVMVGAGFSKNAGQGFPDWNQLGDLFYIKAHGVESNSTKQKYLNVLRLAEEVQATIGRPALENLLRSNIPDLTIEPSGLHVELLEFPWVDVFTTNYDTLLERASAKVVTRRYEPVVNKEDIPYAIKPRIVKLHGSFPSERPFIITEEDYRRYPHDFAPFVNTVQQALLENTFCLIGFSGDDPNFLQWIGWIRDNLGRDKTQKIYLVGVFDLSSARLQLLAQRGIIVVDFSCCHGIEKQDHKKAFSKFFEYIWSKKPDILDRPPYNSKTLHPTQGVDKIEEVQKITNEWRLQRHAYPGWLVLPHENRENLWASTQPWVNYLSEKHELHPGLDIQYISELIWRLERCLLPIFNNLAEFCEILLERYWPFHTDNSPANCLFSAGEDKFQDLPWKDIREAWFVIMFAMLRYYREEGLLDKWKDAENRIKILINYLSAEQKEFLSYEGFLFSLFILDLPNAKQRLENWRPSDSQPYWVTKRAAGLAEIGQLKEAETLTKDALENIRRKLNQKVGSLDLTLVSLESNAMLIGKYIQDAGAWNRNKWATSQDKRSQFKDRWNELKKFKCDPWNELKIFKLTLKNLSVHRKDITEKRTFDIGRFTRTFHFSNTDQEELSAYSFLRFCEEIGLPFRVGSYTTVATKTADASLQLISRDSSFWATATLVRLGDDSLVDKIFNREAVHRFTANDADQLIHGYLDALYNCQEDIHLGNAFRNDNYGVRLAQLLPEIISRLCCKCSIETKHRILEFITGIYASPDKNNYRNIGSLTKRLISSMTEMEQYSIVPELLKIPFPENLNRIVTKDFLNPFLLIEHNQKLEYAPIVKIQLGLVDDLLWMAELDNLDRRRWAISSLVTLHKLQLLDDDQNSRFGKAIWRIIDQYGLPDGTDFRKFVFLRLPHPENVDPPCVYKAYIKATPFPIQKNKQDGGVAITGGDIDLVNEIIGANDNGIWSTEDAIEILERLLEWWDADKDRLSEKEIKHVPILSISEEFRSRFARMVDLVVKVIAPKFCLDSPEDIKASLDRLLSEIRGGGLLSLEAEAACLHIYPGMKADIYQRINWALISNQENIATDALSAIAKIITGSSDSIANSAEPDPLSMLNQYLTWSPTNSVATALGVVVRILKNKPNNFTDNIEATTQKRLDRLLTETTYDDENTYLIFDKKLEIRRITSILAASLWAHYRSRGVPVPLVVEKWREECSSPNEFSEIRNAWKERDST